MHSKLISRRILLVLTAAAVVTPIVICVIVALGQLLAAMDDAAAGTAIGWIAAAFGAFWVLDLICLVLVQAINTLGEADDPSESE